VQSGVGGRSRRCAASAASRASRRTTHSRATCSRLVYRTSTVLEGASAGPARGPAGHGGVERCPPD
jgi:hypothetical protein